VCDATTASLPAQAHGGFRLNLPPSVVQSARHRQAAIEIQPTVETHPTIGTQAAVETWSFLVPLAYLLVTLIAFFWGMAPDPAKYLTYFISPKLLT